MDESDAKAMQSLQRLKELGFDFLMLPRYERQVAAERGGFVALLEYVPGGQIRQFSSAGYLIDNQIAMLVHSGGESYFMLKQTCLPADAEMLDRYARFQADLRAALEEGG